VVDLGLDQQQIWIEFTEYGRDLRCVEEALATPPCDLDAAIPVPPAEGRIGVELHLHELGLAL
jgi:hypothetical protein